MFIMSCAQIFHDKLTLFLFFFPTLLICGILTPHDLNINISSTLIYIIFTLLYPWKVKGKIYFYFIKTKM